MEKISNLSTAVESREREISQMYEQMHERGVTMIERDSIFEDILGFTPECIIYRENDPSRILKIARESESLGQIVLQIVFLKGNLGHSVAMVIGPDTGRILYKDSIGNPMPVELAQALEDDQWEVLDLSEPQQKMKYECVRLTAENLKKMTLLS